MIDWLTLRVNSEFRPEAGTVVSLTADGEVEWRIEKRVAVEGSHSCNVHIRTVPYGGKLMGGNLEISGNPAKFFQGHNLFGTDDLAPLVQAFVLAVYDRIGYQPTAAEVEQLRVGWVWIRRLDVNRNSDFGSRPRALNAIRALSECGHISHRGRGSLVGEGTVQWAPSRYWSPKVYAKGLEIQKHKLPKDLPMVAELHRFADGLVRREVTIWARELQRRKLHLLANWSRLGASPMILFDDMFGRLTISEATMKEPAELDAIPPKLRTVYQLWADGHDLRELFPTRTFYRHRKALLALGIDIAVKQPRDVSNVVPLVVTLVGREVGVPEWAQGTSLYFDPRASRVA